MDLGSCPKCGEPWSANQERCPNCGFVAIGAGLRSVPKKKKARVVYREPGAWAPFLAFLFLVFLVGAAVVQAPWKDGFAKVKSLFGIVPVRKLEGDWEIVKLVTLDPSSRLEIAPANLVSGKFTFQPPNGASYVWRQGGTTVNAEARYGQVGRDLTFRDIRAQPSLTMPREISMQVSWLDDNTLIGQIPPNAALYLRRVKPGETASIAETYRFEGGRLKAR